VKMMFEAWGRMVMRHYHKVRPVKWVNNKYTPSEPDEPLVWVDSLKALGKVNDLGLTGDFLVEFKFELEELKNWLKEYVKAEPEAAIRLLAEMQAEAMIALARKPQEQKQEEDSLYVELSGE
jgi:nitrogen regulatory protein PII-like uncharacterized protein